MNQLQESLNQLWSGTIKNHLIDLFNHTIEFEIDTLNDGKSYSHYLKFTKVKSFYYINDQVPFEPEEIDYLELSSVYYEFGESKKIEVSSTKSSEYYRSTKTNFILEIWGRELYIETTSVEVNGNVYDIGLLS